MGAHFKAYLEELATLAVNKPGGVQSMRGTFAVSKYVAKAMLVRRWTARIVWGMQRQAAAQILATWRANAFLRSSRSQSAAALVGVPRLALLSPLLVLLVRVRESGFCRTIWIRFFYCMAVVAVPFILYLVRFCSSKSCKIVVLVGVPGGAGYIYPFGDFGTVPYSRQGLIIHRHPKLVLVQYITGP